MEFYRYTVLCRENLRIISSLTGCLNIKQGVGFMNIEQAIDIIYSGLVSENSVPVQLAAYRILDLEMLNQVREALHFAIEYYRGKTLIPKKIAIALVDIQGAFFFKSGFDEEMLVELEDIGIELQEKALELFSE